MKERRRNFTCKKVVLNIGKVKSKWKGLIYQRKFPLCRNDLVFPRKYIRNVSLSIIVEIHFYAHNKSLLTWLDTPCPSTVTLI